MLMWEYMYNISLRTAGSCIKRINLPQHDIMPATNCIERGAKMLSLLSYGIANGGTVRGWATGFLCILLSELSAEIMKKCILTLVACVDLYLRP